MICMIRWKFKINLRFTALYFVFCFSKFSANAIHILKSRIKVKLNLKSIRMLNDEQTAGPQQPAATQASVTNIVTSPYCQQIINRHVITLVTSFISVYLFLLDLPSLSIRFHSNVCVITASDISITFITFVPTNCISASYYVCVIDSLAQCIWCTSSNIGKVK